MFYPAPQVRFLEQEMELGLLTTASTRMSFH